MSSNSRPCAQRPVVGGRIFVVTIQRLAIPGREYNNITILYNNNPGGSRLLCVPLQRSLRSIFFFLLFYYSFSNHVVVGNCSYTSSGKEIPRRVTAVRAAVVVGCACGKRIATVTTDVRTIPSRVHCQVQHTRSRRTRARARTLPTRFNPKNSYALYIITIIAVSLLIISYMYNFIIMLLRGTQ